MRHTLTKEKECGKETTLFKETKYGENRIIAVIEKLLLLQMQEWQAEVGDAVRE